MLKEYQNKIVLSGNVTEIYTYNEPRFKKMEDENRKAVKKVKKAKQKETDEQTQEVITEDTDKEDTEYRRRQRDIAMVRKKMNRIIYANVGQYEHTEKFVTFTFEGELPTRDEVFKKWKRFKERLEYKYKDVEYIAVIERGSSNTKRLHLHVIFFNLPFVPVNDFARIWKYGFVYINKVDGIQGAVHYLLKYVEKTLEDDYIPKGKRFYFTSQGLKKPTEIYLDEDEFIDFASETELGIEQFSTPFASQYVGEGLYMKFMKQTYREEDLPCIPTEKCVVIDTRK